MAEWWEAAPLAAGGGTPAATGSWWESAPLAPPETSFWGRFSGQKPGPLIPSATPDQAGVLPIRKTPQGPEFDYQAGVLGSLLRAISTPGDVLLGDVPTPYGGSNAAAQPSPDVIQRASETAGMMSPINPAVRAGDFAIPGMAKNFQSIAVLPSAQAIKDTANAGYNAVRQSGLAVPSTAVADLANTATRQIGSNFTPTDAPSTYARLTAMANPERSVTSIGDLMSHRDALTGIIGKGGPDSVAARQVRDIVDSQLNNLSGTIPDPMRLGAPPTMAPVDVGSTLQTARANTRSAMSANRITGDLDPAVTGLLERAEGRAAAANSGQNLDNQLRMRAAAILERNKEVASLAPDERAALEAIRDGTFTRNALRQVGNTLGGGGGLGRLWSSSMGGAAGLLAGGPVGAAVGTMATPAIGAAAKMLANRLASGSVTAADELIRSNSPLFQGLLGDAPTYVPGLGRDAAVIRALLGGGLLAPPPQKVPGFI